MARSKSGNSSKKEISTIPSTEQRAKLVDCKIHFHYFARSFLLYYKQTICVVYVLGGFSIECLKTSRDFSLLFQSTIKSSCCFIVSLRWQTSLYASIIFRCIYFSLNKTKIDGKANYST